MARIGRPRTATPSNPFSKALALALETRTQTEIADALGVSQPLISDWLAGRKLPGAALLPGLAEIGIPESIYYEALRERNASLSGYKKSAEPLTA